MKKIIYNPQKDNINDIINSQENLIFVGARKIGENKAIAVFEQPSIELPQIVYEEPPIEQQMNEGDERYETKKLEWGDGIKLWITGIKYPLKIMTSQHAMWSFNSVKRLFIEPIKLSKYFIPSGLFIAILPYKYKVSVLQNIISSYNRIALGLVSPILIKDQYLTRMAKELKYFIFHFLREIGIEHKDSMDFARVFANAINYDVAYYFRFLDLFYETNPNLLKKPAKEVKRLININIKRETLSPQVGRKMKQAAFIIYLMLLHPKIKKAFIRAVEKSTFENFLPDEGDIYWMENVRKDYNFFGKN